MICVLNGINKRRPKDIPLPLAKHKHPKTSYLLFPLFPLLFPLLPFSLNFVLARTDHARDCCTPPLFKKEQLGLGPANAMKDKLRRVFSTQHKHKQYAKNIQAKYFVRSGILFN